MNEFEKRHAAAAVSRKFGLPASEVMYVRDGYELVRYLMRCAEQCRSRVAAIYPAAEQPALSRAVADSLNGVRPVLLSRFVRPIRCSYLQMPGSYGGLLVELEYVCTGAEHARRMASMEAALARRCCRHPRRRPPRPGLGQGLRRGGVCGAPLALL